MVEVLHLDMAAEQISPEEPLFSDDGLALDSIDGLELATVLEKKYSCGLRSDDKSNDQAFTSLATLAAFVEKNKTK
ncbi:hypothetical protein BGC07_07270 [Piscirickettsia litoralis]|uniref:Carrier domain-containing protein n=2 Tax=Piscirickettsia litoralis TaxID=1891921 RepID=A0ABX3A585_9GAMM|nr:hypothetical protein BGC07_07270 [Piscirickettsia litoralis]